MRHATPRPSSQGHSGIEPDSPACTLQALFFKLVIDPSVFYTVNGPTFAKFVIRIGNVSSVFHPGKHNHSQVCSRFHETSYNTCSKHASRSVHSKRPSTRRSWGLYLTVVRAAGSANAWQATLLTFPKCEDVDLYFSGFWWLATVTQICDLSKSSGSHAAASFNGCQGVEATIRFGVLALILPYGLDLGFTRSRLISKYTRQQSQTLNFGFRALHLCARRCTGRLRRFREANSAFF